MELQQVLPADPASAAAARRLAEETLRAWHRDELVDVTTLLVSELVTNAVLHAGSDIALRLLSSGAGVRVEVGDNSAVLPSRRTYGREATTGRGLGLVEMLAGSWGAEARSTGKVVWFQVGGVALDPRSEEELVEAFLDPEESWPEDPVERAGSRHRSDPRSLVEIWLLGLPIGLYRAMEQHNDALLREFMLHRLGQNEDETSSNRSPLDAGASAARLPLNTPAVDADLDGALGAGRTRIDLRLTVPSNSRDVCAELLVVLDEADDLARRGGLLVPGALPEVRACRRWSLGEVIAQVDGAEPAPWSPPEINDFEGPLRAQIEPGAVLDSLGVAVIVGDDENRILAANAAAEGLLGWSKGELDGRRITVIVPERLHEAHVVGYSHYLVTGEQRLIGRPVRVSARHRSGDEVPIELVITTFQVPSGRQVFVAALRALADHV